MAEYKSRLDHVRTLKSLAPKRPHSIIAPQLKEN